MNNGTCEYFDVVKNLFDKIAATDLWGQEYKLTEAIENARQLICRQAEAGGKLLFIGNGASASIASHMATDFWKNGGIKALAFNDGCLLTCVSNDFGYEYVFEKPIEVFAGKADVLFAISSSGQSDNIVRAAQTARAREVQVVTLSGFKSHNRLRGLGDLNFYVPMCSYGPVEVVHHCICHCILDGIISKKHAEGQKVKAKVIVGS